MARTACTSMFSVPGSISAKTGVPPPCTIMLTVAAKVMGVVITSSPGCSFKASMVRCRPAVAEESGTEKRAPTYCLNASSNRFTLGPVVIQPLFRESTTSLISSSPMVGMEKGRKVARMGRPPTH